MTKLQNAYDLMIMSVIKPDAELRTEAKEAGCYDELMSIRKSMLTYLESSRATLKQVSKNLPTYLIDKPYICKCQTYITHVTYNSSSRNAGGKRQN